MWFNSCQVYFCFIFQMKRVKHVAFSLNTLMKKLNRQSLVTLMIVQTGNRNWTFASCKHKQDNTAVDECSGWIQTLKGDKHIFCGFTIPSVLQNQDARVNGVILQLNWECSWVKLAVTCVAYFCLTFKFSIPMLIPKGISRIHGSFLIQTSSHILFLLLFFSKQKSHLFWL